MTVLKLLACDVCGRHEDADGVEHYVVNSSSRSAQADLCREHAAPLIAMLEEHAVRKGRARRRTPVVSSVDEIPLNGT